MPFFSLLGLSFEHLPFVPIISLDILIGYIAIRTFFGIAFFKFFHFPDGESSLGRSACALHRDPTMREREKTIRKEADCTMNENAKNTMQSNGKTTM